MKQPCITSEASPISIMTRDHLKILIPVVLLAGLFFAMADFSEEQPDVLVGFWQDGGMREAPEFRLPSLRGDSLSLSDYRGQVVVLNIWATWCAPCREEMPDFVRIQDELAERGVQFIGVSIDAGGFEAVGDFAAEFGANYPLVLDSFGEVYGVYRGSVGVPTTYLIDRHGRITKYYPGAVSRRELYPELLSMLSAS